MHPHIEIAVDVNVDRTTTLRMAGDAVSETLSTVRQAFDTARGTGPVIVDLTGVTHIDAAGVDLLREVAGERGLELVMGPDSPVFSIVQVSGLCDVATVQCH